MLHPFRREVPNISGNRLGREERQPILDRVERVVHRIVLPVVGVLILSAITGYILRVATEKGNIYLFGLIIPLACLIVLLVVFTDIHVARVSKKGIFLSKLPPKVLEQIAESLRNLERSNLRLMNLRRNAADSLSNMMKWPEIQRRELQLVFGQVLGVLLTEVNLTKLYTVVVGFREKFEEVVGAINLAEKEARKDYRTCISDLKSLEDVLLES